jgi:hypothetical protein
MEPQVLLFPTVDAAETEGVDAYCLGMDRDTCPYPARTEVGKAWRIGWDDAAVIDRDGLAIVASL